MAQIDHSIYFQQQTPDIMGGIERGLRMSDMIKQKKEADELKLKQKKIDEAYNSGVVQNPDGTISYDKNKALNTIGMLSGQEYLNAKEKFQAQDLADQNAKMQKQMQQLDFVGRAASNIKDQESFNHYISAAKQMGMDTSAFGSEYNPDVKKKLDFYGGLALTKKEQLERQSAQQGLDIQRFNAQTSRMNAESTREKNQFEMKKTGGLTEGEKAVDKDYAKHYNNFTNKGRVNAQAAINRLELLAKEMENDQGFGEAGGGRFTPLMPDFVRARDAIRRRDAARNAANTTLKELFGGQLSDGEREAAAKEYYNDNLGNKENSELLRDKINQLRQGLLVETEKAKYFEKNRTLQGFKFAENTPVGESLGMSSNQDSEAVQWARQNPQDPRASQILRLNGIGGS